MSRECPSCGKAIARLRVEHVRTRGIPWYRYAPPSYSCPHCNAALRTATLPVGYALNLLMALIGTAFLAPGLAHPIWFAHRATPFALLAILLALAECFRRYGFKYMRVDPEVGHAL
jgi:hypothetical protein